MATLPGSRVRNNGVLGAITDNPLTVGAITMNSPDLADLDTITSNHAIITLDPFKQHGDPEIVMVTTHTPASTVATITRGMYGTAPRQHPQGTLWVHAAVDEDFIEIVTSSTRPNDPYEGQFIYETDTNLVLVFDGISWTEFGGGGGGSSITLAYAQVTVDQSGITTETDLTGLSVNVTIPEGRRIKITGFCHALRSVADGQITLRIKEGATEFQQARYRPGSGNIRESNGCSAVITPSAGSHTYKLSLQQEGGTGTTSMSAGPTFPAFILVEDITGDPSPVDPESVPVGLLAQAIGTTPFAGITSEITLLSVNIVVPAGRILEITAGAIVQLTAAGTRVLGTIKLDGVTVGRWIDRTGGAGDYRSASDSVLISPSADAHVITMHAQSITGTTTVEGSSAAPIHLFVEDITPTPSPSPGAPSSTLAYAEKLSNQTGTTGITDITDLTATVTVPSGRRIKIQGHLGVGSTVVGDILRIRVQEGGSTLQIRDVFVDVVSATTGNLEIDAVTVETPTAGMHTYKLTIERLSGSGTWVVAGNATFPAFILVEDITGAVFPAGSEVSVGMIASEPWTPWTPTLTNLTLGNGTMAASFTKIGRTIHYRFKLTFGTTTTMGTAPTFSLPATADAGHTTQGIIGDVALLDSGTAVWRGTARATSTTTGIIQYYAATANQTTVSATAPFTWTTNDELNIAGTYEAAS